MSEENGVGDTEGEELKTRRRKSIYQKFIIWTARNESWWPTEQGKETNLRKKNGEKIIHSTQCKGVAAHSASCACASDTIFAR